MLTWSQDKGKGKNGSPVILTASESLDSNFFLVQCLEFLWMITPNNSFRSCFWLSLCGPHFCQGLIFSPSFSLGAAHFCQDKSRTTLNPGPIGFNLIHGRLKINKAFGITEGKHYAKCIGLSWISTCWVRMKSQGFFFHIWSLK